MLSYVLCFMSHVLLSPVLLSPVLLSHVLCFMFYVLSLISSHLFPSPPISHISYLLSPNLSYLQTYLDKNSKRNGSDVNEYECRGCSKL